MAKQQRRSLSVIARRPVCRQPFACDRLHVEVSNASPTTFATRGAGIGTHDEMFSILRRLGITVDASIGVEVRERVCLDHDGKVLCEVALPQMMTAWARIYSR